MKASVALSIFVACVFLAAILVPVESHTQDNSALLSRQVRQADCGSKICKDCAAPCTGCDMCPLCAFCFGNTNPPCDNCKHCGTGDSAISDCKA